MIHSLQETVTLNCGVEMPGFGLGCFKAKGEEAVNAIAWAVETGYRLFDTAARYENERDVGRGIRACGVPRERLFVVTKIWPAMFDKPDEALVRSLTELDIGYLDAVLLHWPGMDRNLRLRAWEAILNAVEKKMVRCAGVSNFQPEHLDDLISAYGVVPAINQIELHPWYREAALVEYCRRHSIAVEAWGPILHGHIGEMSGLDEIAGNCRRTPAQVMLRWHLQNGIIPIPKSSNRERIAENARLFDFALNQEDMCAIDAMDCGRHFGSDPYAYGGEDWPAKPEGGERS